LLATIVYMPISSTEVKTGESKCEMTVYALIVFVISALNIYLFYQVYQLEKFTHRK